MGPETFVPFLFFTFLTAVIVVPIMAKEATKRSAHQLVSQAIARGQTLDPDVLQRLSQDVFYDGNRARRNLGNGVILLALALGFVLTGVVTDNWGWDHHNGMMIPAIIMGCVGAAFLALAAFDYTTKPREMQTPHTPAS